MPASRPSVWEDSGTRPEGGPAIVTKYVYAFGGGAAEGSSALKNLLGGKGAGLAEMSRLGIPVPPGFTLTTEACNRVHESGGWWPAGLEEEVLAQLQRVERQRGERFGDPQRPLLVSVRSGAVVSMPGMMDTVLDVGLTRSIVEARCDGSGDAESAFWLDCYRRLLTMFGNVVLGLPAAELHAAMEELEKGRRESGGGARLGAAALRGAIVELEQVYQRHGKELPQDPFAQLRAAIEAVFASWGNRRAREYRRLHGISDDLGTGATVQTMVFGNRGPRSATGVAFTRNPATGEAELYGEYLLDAQGEDVVAGTHTPSPLRDAPGSLAEVLPEAHEELRRVAKLLERHFRNMQDLEFTVDRGRLYLLQTRTGKRSGPAAVRIAVEMVDEGLIDEREALRRVEPQHLVQMMAPVFDAAERERAIDGGLLLARGLPAGPGAASGRIAFDADRAAAMAQDGAVLLVRDETSPEDIVGMYASVGILTTRGGMTSHAAVVARGLGKPCIVGAGDLQVDAEAGLLRAGSRAIREGEWLSIDGTAGEVLAGALSTRPSEVLAAVRGKGERSPAAVAFERLVGWADRQRRLRVRANADTPEDAALARALGAEGIGLCRTEHMFFDEERIPWVRRLILARDEAERQKALVRLLPVQQEDFTGILRALEGLPVTIRLLDPPLHEFLPREDEAIERLAAEMDVPVEHVRAKVESLAESNPMLGHRGCRLGLTAPEIYDMQTEAIARAACRLAREGVEVRPEIMIPLVGVEEEIARLRRRTAEIVERIALEEGAAVTIPIGTMIEVPRAALIAGKLARHVDFFSFGTNDLTQMTYGFSRDDVARFLNRYVEEGILPHDPFARLDTEGVGQLVEMSCRLGRAARSDLKLGICGEHGGDPHSIAFFEAVGLDYVSCSPYRVPIARLAAARATLGVGAEMGDEALSR